MSQEHSHFKDIKRYLLFIFINISLVVALLIHISGLIKKNQTQQEKMLQEKSISLAPHPEQTMPSSNETHLSMAWQSVSAKTSPHL